MFVAGEEMLMEHIGHALGLDLLLEECQIIGPVVGYVQMLLESVSVRQQLNEACIYRCPIPLIGYVVVERRLHLLDACSKRVVGYNVVGDMVWVPSGQS